MVTASDFANMGFYWVMLPIGNNGMELTIVKVETREEGKQWVFQFGLSKPMQLKGWLNHYEPFKAKQIPLEVDPFAPSPTLSDLQRSLAEKHAQQAPEIAWRCPACSAEIVIDKQSPHPVLGRRCQCGAWVNNPSTIAKPDARRSGDPRDASGEEFDVV